MRGQLYEANAELKLAAPPFEPLHAHQLNGADPKQEFAGIFAKLRDDLRERAIVAVDLRPVPNARAHKLRAFWLERAGGTVSRGTLSEPETRGTPIGTVVTRRQDTARLDDKLNPKEILFELQVLIHVESEDRDRVGNLMRAFLTAFGQWKGANEFVAHGTMLAAGGYDLRFWGPDAFRWRRWWFKLRLQRGLWWPAAPALVTAQEIGGLIAPWLESNKSTAPYRSGGVTPPAPVALPTYDPAADLPSYAGAASEAPDEGPAPVEEPAAEPAAQESA